MMLLYMQELNFITIQTVIREIFDKLYTQKQKKGTNIVDSP